MAGSSKGAKSESGRHEEPSGVLPRGQILCPLKRLTSCLPLPQVFGYLVHPVFVSYAAPLLASEQCGGVLSAELHDGWEASPAVQATVAILAAQLTTLVAPISAVAPADDEETPPAEAHG